MKRILALVVVVMLGACQRAPAPAGGTTAAPSEAVRDETAPPPDERAAPAERPEEPTTAGGGAPVLFTFDADEAGALPAGLVLARTGPGPVGRWIVQDSTTAPSAPHVLAQLDPDDTDMRFPLAVTESAFPADVRVSVRCSMISGRVDQACGLVLRYRDENNYLITRANALENNIRLYTVRDGQRHQLASWSGAVTPTAWHEYRFEARGDHLEVYWDGARVLDHHDATFTEAGPVGLWTKADSVTHFDDLRVEAL